MPTEKEFYAFPHKPWVKRSATGSHLEDVPGMTLRDYYSARAPEVPGWFMFQELKSSETSSLDILIKWQFTYADAMLKEREKHE